MQDEEFTIEHSPIFLRNSSGLKYHLGQLLSGLSLILKAIWLRADAVIAPTTVDFIEGFNKVVLEGVLSGRPVITSSACPAIEDVRAATVEVEPNDVEGYRKAVLELCDNISYYETKRESAKLLAQQFYRKPNTWKTQVTSALSLSGV